MVRSGGSVSVPELGTSSASAQRSTHHPGHDHSAREIEQDQEIGTLGEQLADDGYCHSVTHLVPSANCWTSFRNLERGSHCAP